jgi:hypothetical protein
MKLGDVLAITSEHVNVSVIDCATGEVIAYYDGKNSIGVELNDKEIVKQYVQVINPSRYLGVGQLCIEIIN